MNQDIKAKRVHDLRTTQAGQCEGKLNDGKGGYCCLGRLCEVMGKGWGSMHDTYKGLKVEGTKEACYLPNLVAIEAGLEPDEDRGWVTPAVTLGQGAGTHKLSQLNDAGFTFKQIADLVEYAL